MIQNSNRVRSTGLSYRVIENAANRTFAEDIILSYVLSVLKGYERVFLFIVKTSFRYRANVYVYVKIIALFTTTLFTEIIVIIYY